MKRYKVYWITLSLLILMIIGLNIRLPYDLVMPGHARTLTEGGNLHMVTAMMGKATPFRIFSSWEDPYSVLIPADENNVDEEEERKKMLDSQTAAKQVAFKITGDQPKDIPFDLDQIVGPSAGLMMTLDLIDQLTDGDLSQGRKVAGTGTILPDGQVGEIGAVQFKIIAADRANMDIFFLPRANMDQADQLLETYPTNMKIIPVATIQEALENLNFKQNRS